MVDFRAHHSQTRLDGGFAVLGAAAQAIAQGLDRRRQNKNADRLRKHLAHLLGALPVDFQQDVAPQRQLLAQPAQRGAVVIAIHLGVFQKILAGDHRLEGDAVNKMIVLTVHLARARLARGVRHRQLHVLVGGQQGGHQRGLARAGRRGDDENVSGLHGGNSLDNHRGNRSG